MAQIRLVPSAYSVSNTQYVTVTSPSNMYTDTDSTTYATGTSSRASTTTYYVYVKGFNFSSLPSGAVVTGFTVKYKANESNLNTSTSYRPRLVNNTTTLTAASTVVGTSVNTYSFTGVSPTWDDIVGYGSNFGVRISIRRSSSNTQGYLYIYGVEILVDYYIPVYYNVSVSGAEPSGTTSVLEGEAFTARGTTYSSKPTVTDNGVDVTSQVTAVQSDNMEVYPSGNTNSNFTLTNISNAYNSADNDTYAQLALSGGTTGTIYFNFGAITLPTGATLQSVACSATIQFNNNGSSSGFTASCQMYSNTTAKGSSTSIATSSTAVPKTTFNLSVGSWTSSDLSNPRLYITATNSASQTVRYLYVYGATLTVTYSISGYIYVYTISSVNEAHTIVFTAGTVTNALYFKDNGSWVQSTRAYKKVNGSWVQQADLTTVFVSGTKYIKGN